MFNQQVPDKTEDDPVIFRWTAGPETSPHSVQKACCSRKTRPNSQWLSGQCSSRRVSPGLQQTSQSANVNPAGKICSSLGILIPKHGWTMLNIKPVWIHEPNIISIPSHGQYLSRSTGISFPDTRGIVPFTSSRRAVLTSSWDLQIHRSNFLLEFRGSQVQDFHTFIATIWISCQLWIST